MVLELGKHILPRLYHEAESIHRLLGKQYSDSLCAYLMSLTDLLASAGECVVFSKDDYEEPSPQSAMSLS